METPEEAIAQARQTAAYPDTRAPGHASGHAPLTADDRLLLMLAGIIAAELVRDFADKEFNGMRSPRFESAMHRSLSIARSLLKRHRADLESAAR